MYSVGDLVMMVMIDKSDIIGSVINIDPVKARYEVEWYTDHDKLNQNSSYIKSGKAFYEERIIKTFRDRYIGYCQYSLNKP